MIRPHYAALTFLFVSAMPITAFADAPEVMQSNWRWDEDWSVLRDAPPDGPWWQPLKYVPLSADSSAWASFGMEARLRYEGFRNNLWGDGPAPDDGYLWRRVMPHADIHLGPFRAFGQLTAADALGVGAGEGPADATKLDRLQSFVDLRLPLGADSTLTFRGGRELLPLGSERLIGTRYGPNVPQAFEGGRAILDLDKVHAQFIAARPIDVRPDTFDDRRSRTERLYGVYITTHVADEVAFDLYWLGYRNDDASFFQGDGRERRETFGVRAFGTSGGWEWNWEAMLQRGRFASDDIRAWSIGTETSYGFDDVSFGPQVLLRANIASGDKNPNDGKLGTFNAMFPKGKYFGELSPIGPANIMNLQPGIEFDLGNSATLGLAGTAYWRASRDDGLYDVPGQLIRDGDDTRARFVGTQGEMVLGWQADQAFSASISYSIFEPGTFIKDSGPAKTIHMLGAEIMYRF
ncbi:alginate export family protein [Marinivivus vitaminiproducens]|uniref:alginate export family protein n=1 Tax=Marinivivus vitaminiproducens TaxID=3035935 RepID=UPI0027A8E565|nr:alginate export family protein [Geminicoccaceae bacterium SCSIO 64248]